MVAFGFKTPPQHGTWTEFLDVWRAADDIDVFESGWTMDHFYPLTAPLSGPILESWTMLAALAQATTRLRLGSMVNGMHFRHPAVTANMAATVDHVSNGRFVLGMGAGWFEAETQAYGMELGTKKERSDRFEEGIEVIWRLLRQPTTTFDGSYYQLNEAFCEPKPIQAPLPIAIGGSGPTRTLKVVARWADHWDTFANSVEQWQDLRHILAGHCAAVGRDPADITHSLHMMWPADADPSALADQAAPYVEAGVDLIIYSMRGPFQASLLEPLADALRQF
jgi:F420-dependent oxidoreductase-like protein